MKKDLKDTFTCLSITLQLEISITSTSCSPAASLKANMTAAMNRSTWVFSCERKSLEIIQVRGQACHCCYFGLVKGNCEG